MDYAAPAPAWEGLLSGLGHPVIGIDHLAFIIGAGVLAARVARGMFLPLGFVAASIFAVGLRVAGVAIPLEELWVALSLVALGAVLLASRGPGKGTVTALFLLAGAAHGYALAEGIVGAEQTPLYSYLADLIVVECLIAYAAWGVAGWVRKARPAIPLERVAGISLTVAGLYFGALATMG